ncbi:MAG: hypothetical protein ACI4BI_06795 [Anaerotardibacter sp.]
MMAMNRTSVQIKAIAQEQPEFCRFPLATEIYSDVRTPMEVLRILKGVSSPVYLLESAEAAEKWGRYTFLGYDPVMEITARDGVVCIDGQVQEGTNPVAHIRQAQHHIKRGRYFPGSTLEPLGRRF